ncbi:hypothetical protein HDU96_008909 [Phlyctochytrium bullatum]|nr:hypothetical protein HDU96_008909 [Phlyctochytrium bullatum]
MAESTATPMTVQDKIEKGKSEKDLGNAAFKSGDMKLALRHYHTAVLYLSGLDNAHLKSFVGGQQDLEDAIKNDIKLTINTCHTNMAACHLKNGNWEKAIKSCDKVLEKTPDNAKALFRRGKANLELKNVDKAESDLKKALELEPKDAGIRAELEKIKVIHKQYDEKQKKEWAGMFDRKPKAGEAAKASEFVNGLVDAAQKGAYAASVASLAESIGLPSWFTDLRHAGTHDYLPGIDALRMGCDRALHWLHDNYWVPQQAYAKDTGTEVRELLDKYRDILEDPNITEEITSFILTDSYSDFLMPTMLASGYMIHDLKGPVPSYPDLEVGEPRGNWWWRAVEWFEQQWPGFFEDFLLALINLLCEPSDEGPDADIPPEEPPLPYLLSAASWCKYMIRKTRPADIALIQSARDACFQNPNRFTYHLIPLLLKKEGVSLNENPTYAKCFQYMEIFAKAALDAKSASNKDAEPTENPKSKKGRHTKAKPKEEEETESSDAITFTTDDEILDLKRKLKLQLESLGIAYEAGNVSEPVTGKEASSEANAKKRGNVDDAMDIEESNAVNGSDTPGSPRKKAKIEGDDDKAEESHSKWVLADDMNWMHVPLGCLPGVGFPDLTLPLGLDPDTEAFERMLTNAGFRFDFDAEHHEEDYDMEHTHEKPPQPIPLSEIPEPPTPDYSDVPDYSYPLYPSEMKFHLAKEQEAEIVDKVMKFADAILGNRGEASKSS